MFKINNNVNIDLTPINESIDNINNSIFNLNDNINQISNNQNLTWFTLNTTIQRTDALMISDVYDVLTHDTVNYAVNNSIDYFQEYRVPFCHAISDNNIYHKQLTESSEILGLLNPTTYTRGANLISLSDASRNSGLYTAEGFNTYNMYFYGMNDYNLLKNYDNGVFIEPKINDINMQNLTYNIVLHIPTQTSTFDLNFGSINTYRFVNRTSGNLNLKFNSEANNIDNFQYLAVEKIRSGTLTVNYLNCKSASFISTCNFQGTQTTNTSYSLSINRCKIDNLKMCNPRLLIQDATVGTVLADQNYVLQISQNNQTLDGLCATDKLTSLYLGKLCTFNNATLSPGKVMCSSNLSFNNCSLNVGTYSLYTDNRIELDFNNCTLNTGFRFSAKTATVGFDNCQGLQELAGTISYPLFKFNNMHNTTLSIASNLSYSYGNVGFDNCENFTYIDALNSMNYSFDNVKNCKAQVGKFGNIKSISNATMTLYDLDAGSIRSFTPSFYGNNSINFTYDSLATYRVSQKQENNNALLKIDGWDDTQSKNAYISILPNLQGLTVSGCSVAFDAGAWPTVNKTLCLYDNYYTTNKSTISGLDYLAMSNEAGNLAFFTLNLENNNRLLIGDNIVNDSLSFMDCTHPILQNCKASHIHFDNCNSVDIVDNNKLTNSQTFQDCSSVYLDLRPGITHDPFLSFYYCRTIEFANSNITLESARFEYITSVISPVDYIKTITIRFGDEPRRYCNDWDEVMTI